MRVVALIMMFGCCLSACGDKSKPAVDGGSSGGDSGVALDSGTSSVDSGASEDVDAATANDQDASAADADAATGDVDAGAGDAGAGDGIAAPAAGKVIINATFSNADGDYNGMTSDYVGVEDMGSTEFNSGIYYFHSHDATSRAIVVQINELPKAGKTYELTDANMLTVGAITFSEAPNVDSAKQYKCFGSVTIDKLTGNTFFFHFMGDCEPNAFKAMGKVSVMGEGAGTFTN